MAAHEVLSELYTALSGERPGALLKDLWGRLAEENSFFEGLLSSCDGVRLVPGEIPKDRLFARKFDRPQPRKPGMELILSEWTFGTEELSAYSRFAIQGESPPRLFMHPDDAERLGLAGGGKAALRMDGGEVVFDLALASNMAAGLIIAPRHRQVEWRKLKGRPIVVPDDCISNA